MPLISEIIDNPNLINNLNLSSRKSKCFFDLKNKSRIIKEINEHLISNKTLLNNLNNHGLQFFKVILIRTSQSLEINSTINIEFQNKTLNELHEDEKNFIITEVLCQIMDIRYLEKLLI